MKVKSVVEVFVFIGGVLGSAIGGWDFSIFLLSMFVLVDFIQGLYIAWFLHKSPKTKSGKASSKVGFHGIGKKVSIFMVVALMHGIDIMFDIDYLRTATIFAYMFNEGTSIIENLIIMDVYVPEIVKRGIDLLDKKEGESHED